MSNHIDLPGDLPPGCIRLLEHLEASGRVTVKHRSELPGGEDAYTSCLHHRLVNSSVETSDTFEISPSGIPVLRAVPCGYGVSLTQRGRAYLAERRLGGTTEKVALPPPAPSATASPAVDQSEQKEATSDGPHSPDKFTWHGKTFTGLTPVPWRLVNHLWNVRRRVATFNELAKPVWGDHAEVVDANRVGSARKRLNRFFLQHKIPLRISTANETASLTALPIDSDAGQKSP